MRNKSLLLKKKDLFLVTQEIISAAGMIFC